MNEFSDRFPTTIIDSSDKDLYTLAKQEADNMFSGDANELFILMLIKKNKMVRFSHDFANDKLYIDFPNINEC